MEFDLPWRIHWRPGPNVSLAIVDSIKRANPLAVTIHIEDEAQLETAGLPWDGTSLVIVHHGWRNQSLSQSAPLTSHEVSRWEFPIGGPGEVTTLAETGFLGVDPSTAALRWYPVSGKFNDLVKVLELAAEHGCSVTLPNRPAGVITSEGEGAFPDPSELDPVLAGAIKAAAAAFDPGRIRVHDFILSRILELESTEPSGCEAANAIAYVDEKGTVYPCETLMVPMGQLGREELDSIWASPVRARVRSDVEKMPGICVRCPELAMCRAGCRGAVYHLKGHYGDIDPLCPVDS